MITGCRSLKRKHPAAYKIRQRLKLQTCRPHQIYVSNFKREAKFKPTKTVRPHVGWLKKARKKALFGKVSQLVKTANKSDLCLKHAIRAYSELRDAGFDVEMVVTKNSPKEEYFLSKNRKAKFHIFVRVKEGARKYVYVDLSEGGVVPPPSSKPSAVTIKQALAFYEMREAISYTQLYEQVRATKQGKRLGVQTSLWDSVAGWINDIYSEILFNQADHHYRKALRYDANHAPTLYNYARFIWVARRDFKKTWTLNGRALAIDSSYREALMLKRVLVSSLDG